MPQSGLFHRTYGAGSKVHAPAVLVQSFIALMCGFKVSCTCGAVSKVHRTNVLVQSFCSAESASKAEPNALTNYQLPITNYQSPSGTQK